MENTKLVVNLSSGKPWFNQRNNLDDPMNSCNVTACVSALSCIDAVYTVPGSMQDEDYLASITDTPEMIAVRDRLGSWAKAFPPRQVFAVLVASVNKMVGKRVATFKDNLTTRDLVMGLLSNKAYVVSTMFVGTGHIVTIVGFSYNAGAIRSVAEFDESKLEGFIIDDPYGDYKSRYANKTGNDIFVPLADFKRLFKPVNTADVKYGIEFSNI